MRQAARDKKGATPVALVALASDQLNASLQGRPLALDSARHGRLPGAARSHDVAALLLTLSLALATAS